MKHLCKFCGKEPPVIKSHVVPEYLYKDLYDEKHRLIIIDEKLKTIGVQQKGHYEPILCKDCEKYFNQTFENPCLNFFDQIPHILEGDYLKIDQPCPELKALCLSILWRSSQCKDEKWNISLGPHEEKLRNALKSKAINFQTHYQIWGFIPVTDDKRTLKGAVSPPQMKKLEAHHFFVFICGCIQFCINISSHRMRELSSEPLDFGKSLVLKSVHFEKTPSLFHVFN